MSPEQRIIITDLIGLVAWCAAYAKVLDSHPNWYLPNRERWAVVVGNGFIIIALGILELFGIQLTIMLVFLANCAGGAPILVWQAILDARRDAELATMQRMEQHRYGSDGTRR